MSIYVEILVRAPLAVLWANTQAPECHQRWDLRFSRITYLPRRFEADPQRFLYATRIGLGLEVNGEGETLGHRTLPDGAASSALRFSSAHPVSIIREGSGYWKYVPTSDGVRFLTSYDYRTRFGTAGAVFDRMIFRPLLGWATAWSFDRLRLWLERGIDPASALRFTLVHAVARATLAAIFAYHGLVPKLLARNADEILMLRDAGLSSDAIPFLLNVIGALELAFAALLLIGWRHRFPAYASIGAMAVATVVVGLYSARYFGAAFNPFSLNLAVTMLAAIDLLVLGSVPSAARCRRRPGRE